MTAKISGEQLKRKIDAGENFALVEALPRQYWAKWHIPGALNIPHDRIEALASELLPDKHREVVVYCANDACQNSEIAARSLADLGYTEVSVYVEGKAGWESAGYPLERPRKVA